MLKDFVKFTVGHHEIQTIHGCIHIMSFMNLIGISINYPHLAYNRLSTIEQNPVNFQLSRAAHQD